MKKHPSGRPIRQPNRRDYSMARTVGVGFRCPRLNPQHIEQATDTHAIGFIDWSVRAAQDELEGRKR